MRNQNTIESIYGINVLSNADLTAYLEECKAIYKGNPYWMDEEITTVNFAKTVCGEIARLATMDIDISADGSARAEWLQGILDDAKEEWRNWAEFGVAYGTIILKPSESTIDIVTPDNFRVLGASNGHITDIIFIDSVHSAEQDIWYTRLERHKRDEEYIITNRTFKGSKKGELEKECDISVTPWAGLAEEVKAEGIEGMLFGVFRMPGANHVDESSPMGLPCFANAIVEMEDLDTAYSLNAYEVKTSRKIVMLDSDRLCVGRLGSTAAADLVKAKGLPSFVKLVEGDGVTDVYKEILPTLNTETRQNGINNLLSQIGFKCGFSNGYFVFNEKTGMVTATQVESDDRRTLQLINDVREQLKACISSLVYAISKMADAYGWAPKGDYELAYDFLDLTLNREEDKARWLSYVQQGFIPFWRYLVMWEGYTEEDAKEIAQERETPRLFED